jgi:hypothetical protein
LPFVTWLIVAAMVAVPAFLANETQQSGQPAIALYESAREDARNFLVRNPQLEVDSTGALILDADWLGEMRKAAAESEANAGTKVELRPRMLARSQARLDAFIADAYALRKRSDPSWQYGVLDARTPTRNYFVHAFVQNNEIGIALCVVVMLLVGIALELTWGSLILAAFAIAIVPLTAQAYRLLDASGGVPWSGGAGLVGAFAVSVAISRFRAGCCYPPGSRSNRSSFAASGSTISAAFPGRRSAHRSAWAPFRQAHSD